MAVEDVPALADEVQQLLGERAEVDVGALGEPVERDRIGEITPSRHQRQAVGEFGRVVDELHALEEGFPRQLVVAFAQVLHTGVTVGERDMRDRIDELARAAEDALVDGVSPELARHLELLVDGDRLVDVHVTVGGLRRVVEFTQRRVTGACVVPRIAGLGGGGVETLEQRDRPIRLELLDQGTEGGAHDARTHEGHIRFDRRFRHLDSTSLRSFVA